MFQPLFVFFLPEVSKVQPHFFIRPGGSLEELPRLGPPPCGWAGTDGGAIATPEALPEQTNKTHIGFVGGWLDDGDGAIDE